MSAAKQECGFLGCTNHVAGDYAWQMCDVCYEESSSWEDDGPFTGGW